MRMYKRKTRSADDQWNTIKRANCLIRKLSTNCKCKCLIPIEFDGCHYGEPIFHRLMDGQPEPTHRENEKLMPKTLQDEAKLRLSMHIIWIITIFASGIGRCTETDICTNVDGVATDTANHVNILRAVRCVGIFIVSNICEPRPEQSGTWSAMEMRRVPWGAVIARSRTPRHIENQMRASHMRCNDTVCTFGWSAFAADAPSLPCYYKQAQSYLE